MKNMSRFVTCRARFEAVTAGTQAGAVTAALGVGYYANVKTPTCNQSLLLPLISFETAPRLQHVRVLLNRGWSSAWSPSQHTRSLLPRRYVRAGPSARISAPPPQVSTAQGNRWFALPSRSHSYHTFLSTCGRVLSNPVSYSGDPGF
jgi:hypothetical protein